MGTASQRTHFTVLDGLRGIAAIVVVFYHLANTTGIENYIPHGHLAVDFFFSLSGFVIAYAYEQRLRDGRMRSAELIRVRLVRLLPMVLFGLPLGVASYLLKGDLWFHNLGLFLVYVLAGAFTIALPMHNPFRDNVTPINGPCWSLFFELYIGTVLTLVISRLGNLALAIALVLAWVCLGWNVSKTVYNLGAAPDTFWQGFPRFAFTFGLGFLLWRLQLHRRVGAVSPWLVAAGLLVFLLAPDFGHKNKWFEFASVSFVFPVLILFGAASRPSERVERWAEISGRLSYPLYATHFPVLLLCAIAFGGIRAAVIGVPLAILFAWASLVLYDEPLRKWLAEAMKAVRRPALQPNPNEI